MKEQGVLFKAPMVRAILSDRKTKTRRIVKPQPEVLDGGSITRHPSGPSLFLVQRYAQQDRAFSNFGRCENITCPYGKPGDRLWVRETWRTLAAFDGIKPADLVVGTQIKYDANNAISKPTVYPWSDKARPSIFMPRWASRITLEITDVRVERLQEITEEDAKAEGVRGFNEDGCWVYEDYIHGSGTWFMAAKDSFFSLWESINGYDSLADNPFVWVISFERVEASR